MPKNTAQLDRIVKSLQRIGTDPKTVFYYDCPDCRIIIKRAPVDAKRARTMLSEVATALKDRSAFSGSDTLVYNDNGLDTDTRLFDGLFLPRSYDPTEYFYPLEASD